MGGGVVLVAEVLYRIDWSATSLLSSPCLVAEYLLAGARSKRINRHKQVHKALCHAREALILINAKLICHLSVVMFRRNIAHTYFHSYKSE